jgi:hypothetical protein
MPVRYSDAVAVFEGPCAPEEADALLEWLRRAPLAVADLGACDAPHTALVQLLLAGKVRLAAPPSDPVLAACLTAHLAPAGAPEPAVRGEGHDGGARAAKKPPGRTRLSSKVKAPT